MDKLWSYILAGIIFLFLLYRILRARKKYGPIFRFRKRIKEESKKTLQQHKIELEKNPQYLSQAQEIIKKHQDGITSRELRQELGYLPQAKVNLLLSELEQQGHLEKVKKGPRLLLKWKD